MFQFCCPVCGQFLRETEKTFICEAGHSYDKARRGYVNLLLSNRSAAKRRGDDKLMVRARRDFLGRGYYASLLKTLCSILSTQVAGGARILDVGCGECWYTANLQDALSRQQIPADFAGIDISREALSIASKRGDIPLAVASAFSLPVATAYCSVLLNIFSPLCAEEFFRVLAPGGLLVRVIPLEKHLFALKQAVYDQPYENEVPAPALPGFTLADEAVLRSRLLLTDNTDIQNLFRMTPYYYKTSARDQEKLSALDRLDTEIEFGIRVYRKA